MSLSNHHYHLLDFMPEKRMPLWVVHIPEGKHNARCFHDHFHSELVIVLSGQGEHLLNGETIPISAGDILLIHPGIVHGYDKTADLELVNIIYDAGRLYLPVLDGYALPLFRHFFPDKKETVFCSPSPLLHLKKEALSQISVLIRQMDQDLQTNASGNALYCLALLMQIIVILCRNEEKTDKTNTSPFRIGEIISYLNTHYSSDILIDDLARKVNMSKRNFFLIFKKTTGCTPIRYLIRLRVMRASELLRHSQLSIAEIASRCGFADSNYFCRKFREITGVPPRKFRNAAADKSSCKTSMP